MLAPTKQDHLLGHCKTPIVVILSLYQCAWLELSVWLTKPIAVVNVLGSSSTFLVDIVLSQLLRSGISSGMSMCGVAGPQNHLWGHALCSGWMNLRTFLYMGGTTLPRDFRSQRNGPKIRNPKTIKTQRQQLGMDSTAQMSVIWEGRSQVPLGAELLPTEKNDRGTILLPLISVPEKHVGPLVFCYHYATTGYSNFIQSCQKNLNSVTVPKNESRGNISLGVSCYRFSYQTKFRGDQFQIIW
eukprot:5190045-Amphidinium_carterae.1